MVTDFVYNRDTDKPVAVGFLGGLVWITLADGRVIGNPLAWHPWLAQATPQQRAKFELRAFSIDWPDLDEGLDIEGVIRGVRPRVQSAEVEAAQV